MDESDLSDILDIIPNGHLILTRLEKSLQLNVTNLIQFYAKIEKGQEKTGVPYQYMSTHQKEWADNVIPITRQLSAVDPLVMEKYQKLFALEIAKAVQPQTAQPTANPDVASSIMQTYANTTQQEKPKKQSWVSNLFSKKQEMPQITPFKMSIKEIIDKRKTMQDFYDYITFHNFGIDWCKPISISGEADFHFLDYTGIMNYLSIEQTEFNNRIPMVLTIISEGYETVRATEKKYAVDVATGAVKIGESHRQNY